MEECIFEVEPSKIFINIGTNDISSLPGDGPYKTGKLIANYDEIWTKLGNIARCKVYVMAYYPMK